MLITLWCQLSHKQAEINMNIEQDYSWKNQEYLKNVEEGGGFKYPQPREFTE